MEIDNIDRLMVRPTYAKFKGVTTECVRVWVNKGIIKTIKIDTKEFVVLNDEELEQFKGLNKQ